MIFPTPYTVGVHQLSTAGRDAHRNPVKTYTPPLDKPGIPAKVYGWSTPTTTEPQIPGHERVISDVELYVPPGFPGISTSVVDLPAGQFEVIGDQQDYGAGPWKFKPGATLQLRRITG